MNIKAVRWGIVLLLNLFCAFLAGQIAMFGDHVLLSVGFFCSAMLLMYFSGTRFRTVVSRLRTRMSTPRYRGFIKGVTWGGYGLVLAGSFVWMVYSQRPEPFLPVTANFCILLIFAGIQGRTADIWRNVIHAGILVFLVLCYVSGNRFLVVSIYMCFLVSAGVFLHYEDRLQEANYYRNISLEPPVWFASALCGFIVVGSFLFSLCVSEPSEPLAQRYSSKSTTSYHIFSGNPVRQGGGENESSGQGYTRWWRKWLWVLTVVGIGIALLASIYGLIRYIRKKRKEQAEEEEQEEKGMGTEAKVRSLSSEEGDGYGIPSRFSELQKEIIRKYIDLFETLEEENLGRNHWETPGEVYKKFSTYSEGVQSKVQRITKFFEQVRYGDRSVNRQEVQEMKEISDEILRKVRG